MNPLQKSMMRAHHFPAFIVILHVIMKFILASALRSALECQSGRPRVVLPFSRYLSKVLLVGVFSAIDIMFSQWSLEVCTYFYGGNVLRCELKIPFAFDISHICFEENLLKLPQTIFICYGHENVHHIDSFQYITITLYTLTKTTSVLWLLGFAILLRLEKLDLTLVLIVVMIATGLFMFVYHYTGTVDIRYLIVVQSPQA